MKQIKGKECMEGSEGRRAQDMVKSGKGKASKAPSNSLSSVVVWEMCIKGMVVSVPVRVCVCLGTVYCSITCLVSSQFSPCSSLSLTHSFPFQSW